MGRISSDISEKHSDYKFYAEENIPASRLKDGQKGAYLQETSSVSLPHDDDDADDNDSNTHSTDQPLDTSTNASPKPSPSKWKQILLVIADQWFLFAMGAVILLASQVQVPLAQQHIKETLTTYLTVSIIFFITGSTLDTSLLLSNYRRWRTHLWVQLQCFLLFSALTFAIITLTAITHPHYMDGGLLVGLQFTSCVATTISSNVVMTARAGGNRALTVVQTTLGNFLGVFVSPALVVMYTSVPTWYNAVLPARDGAAAGFVGIYRRVLMQLGLSIYVPMVVGQVVRHFFPNACRKVFVEWKLSKVASLCMLAVIWQTYDSAFASGAFESVPGSNIVYIVFISIVIWSLMFAISFFSSLFWLPKKDVVAVTYCVPAKGTAMGVPLSTNLFVGLSLQLQSKIQ